MGTGQAGGALGGEGPLASKFANSYLPPALRTVRVSSLIRGSGPSEALARCTGLPVRSACTLACSRAVLPVHARRAVHARSLMPPARPCREPLTARRPATCRPLALAAAAGSAVGSKACMQLFR